MFFCFGYISFLYMILRQQYPVFLYCLIYIFTENSVYKSVFILENSLLNSMCLLYHCFHWTQSRSVGLGVQLVLCVGTTLATVDSRSHIIRDLSIYSPLIIFFIVSVFSISIYIHSCLLMHGIRSCDYGLHRHYECHVQLKISETMILIRLVTQKY